MWTPPPSTLRLPCEFFFKNHIANTLEKKHVFKWHLTSLNQTMRPSVISNCPVSFCQVIVPVPLARSVLFSPPRGFSPPRVNCYTNYSDIESR